MDKQSTTPTQYYKLQKDFNETEGQFKARKQVYENVVSQLPKDMDTQEKHLEGVKLSNVFRNVYFMGCNYPEETLKNSKKFWPDDTEIHKIMGWME